ncbi:hypothetical protein ACQR50_09340 [Sphingomonas sp. Xoc002]|uniref:hypothetical protein n=1 Tax=Sphingomonas sp. Xoc002 TaxID=2837624 RepID=UPI003D16C76D
MSDYPADVGRKKSRTITATQDSNYVVGPWPESPFTDRWGVYSKKDSLWIPVMYAYEDQATAAAKMLEKNRAT